MPGELARGTIQALISPDEFERRQAGAPLRMSAEQIEATKDRQSAPGNRPDMSHRVGPPFLLCSAADLVSRQAIVVERGIMRAVLCGLSGVGL
jgi:hypothetical protein